MEFKTRFLCEFPKSLKTLLLLHFLNLHLETLQECSLGNSAGRNRVGLFNFCLYLPLVAILCLFCTKSPLDGALSKNKKFRFHYGLGNFLRNIPVKFQGSDLKSEGGVVF